MKHIIHHYNRFLAAEYVLGTMKGLARQRYQHYLEVYPVLNDAIELWQKDFDSLVDTLPEVAPSPALWHKIKGEL